MNTVGAVAVITSRAVPLGGPRAMTVRRTLPQRARSLVGVAHSEVSTAACATLHGVQLWVALPDAARHLLRGFVHHVPDPVQLDGAVARVLLGAVAGHASPVPTHTPLVGAELVLDPRAVVVLDVRPDFEHGVLVDAGPVLLDETELAPAELGYRPPGSVRLRLTNPGDSPARVMLLGGVPFPEPVLMWWNFVGRTHEEVAGYRQEWEDGSGRFGRVDGYRGAVARLPAPPLPTARLRPRLSPPGHGDPSAWG